MTGAETGIKNVDIYNENFNNFFVSKLNSITPEQRSLIPDTLNIKIFKRGNKASAERLTFQEKLWILSVVFQHHVTIVIDDAENGISAKQFKEAVAAQKGELINKELLESMKVHSSFVLADKDLMNALLYMNHTNTSIIYSLVKEVVAGTDHRKEQEYIRHKESIMAVLQFLVNYEAKKARIRTDYNLTIAEWYALLYFATGEKFGHDFYDKDFRYAYNCNRRLLHSSMKKLNIRGILQQRGAAKQHRYSLTSRGINLLDRILNYWIFKY